MKWLLALVPISLGLKYFGHVPEWVVFVTAVLAIVPLASLVKDATEGIAEYLGPTIGGLLNVSFGNAAELILALFVLYGGEQAAAKAQITGSVIGNALLGLGLGAAFGGFKFKHQKFDQKRTGTLSSMLILALFALLIPAMFDYTERGIKGIPDPTKLDERMSLGVSVVLILLYIANLVYTLAKHEDVFSEADPHHPVPEELAAGDTSLAFAGATSGEGSPTPSGAGGTPDLTSPEAMPSTAAPAERESASQVKETEVTHHAPKPLGKSVVTLIVATIFVAIEAEAVSGALEETAKSFGLSTFFLGITLLAVVGNAAEYISAIYFARRNRMDLVMGITLGATIQVALLVAPILVLFSYAIGKPMTLVFRSPLELVAVAAAAFCVNAIAQDGETNWFEGIMLLGVYAILCVAFFFVTP